MYFIPLQFHVPLTITDLLNKQFIILTSGQQLMVNINRFLFAQVLNNAEIAILNLILLVKH